MSFEALARVRDVTAPSSSALLILYILAEYADADGCCFPSQATLAERAQLSVRAVRANLSLLRKAGLIEQVQRRRKDGSRTSDRCKLLYYRPEQEAESAACTFADRPSKQRQSVKRLNRPLDKRQISAGQAAPAAGLTSFEPITQSINQPWCACERARASGKPAKGLSGRVPPQSAERGWGGECE